MLVRILQRQGHRTEIAVNGREALEKIRHRELRPNPARYHDAGNGWVSGAGILKADSVLREIPVIVCKPSRKWMPLSRCMKRVRITTPKPIDLTLLRAHVRRFR